MQKILSLAALVIVTVSQPLWAQGRPAGVGVQTIEMRMLADTVPVFAEVVTARDGSVATRVAGNVDRVLVQPGQPVRAGDLLLALDTELLSILVEQAEAQVTEAQAGLSTAQVRRDRAQATFDRLDALRASNTVSAGQFEDAEIGLREAQSQVIEAEARAKSATTRLAEAQYRLDRSQLTAPFDGVVLEISTIPGAFLQAGTPVLRLLDADALEVQASVPARYVGALTPGQEITARLEDGTTLPLAIRAVLPLEDPTTRTRSVRLQGEALNAVNSIAVGQSLTVEIPVGAARNVISVPKDALIQGQGGWTVFVAAEGKAAPRGVSLGVPLGDRYEVLSGLQEGDVVVVRGNERLRPGQDIIPTPIETN